MSDAGKIVRFPDLSAIEAEAATWAARLDREDLARESRIEFEEWASRSPQHRDAAVRFAALWSELDLLKSLAEPLPVGPDSSLDTRQPLFPRHGGLRRYAAGVIAASVLLSVIGIGVAVLWDNAAEPSRTYETAVGAQSTVSLSDGSSIVLNTDSRVEVRFSHKKRDIKLVRGEAYFDVVHDKNRPFSVFAGNGVVRDVGTAFAVHLLPKAVEITVTKGDVELAAFSRSAELNGTHPRILGNLTAGQRATFDEKVHDLALVSEDELNRSLAWRDGVLVFTGESLSQVAAEICRYTGINVEISDPRLNSMPVGGYFKVGKAVKIFEALESNFGVRVEWIDATHVRLSSRS